MHFNLGGIVHSAYCVTFQRVPEGVFLLGIGQFFGQGGGDTGIGRGFEGQ